VSEVTAQQHATEAAWRIHEALMDWSSKVDAKATIVLGLESAVVTTFTALSGGWSAPTAGPPALYHWAGIGLLVLSVAASVLVVFPRLDSLVSGRQWEGGFVYFGHLRCWEATDLTDALLGGEVLPVLAQQLIAISRICWRKHRLVQLSITLACAGSVVIAASGLGA
jgi:Family of unknown function (DUF5706)